MKDFIKWMIELAEDFEYKKREHHNEWTILFKNYTVYNYRFYERYIEDLVNTDYFIILLYRVVEAINKRENSIYKIIIDVGYVGVSFFNEVSLRSEIEEFNSNSQEENIKNALEFIYEKDLV